MMIGKTLEKPLLQGSEAVRGRTVSELNQRVKADKLGEGFGKAYQVDISEKAKRSMAVFHCGSEVKISLQELKEHWTRDEELAALDQTIEKYRKMNENYARLGTPYEPMEEWQQQQKRQEEILGKLPQGSLEEAGSPGEKGLYLEKQDLGEVLKNAAGLVEFPAAKAVYIPVTEITTPHYRWTEETGIEETLTEEEEAAGWQTEIRQQVQNDVVRAIEDILKPRETYEEAERELHTEKGLAVWTSLDRETMMYKQTFKNVQGAFGALGSYLNNFQEEFGSDDSFYSTLINSLQELDPDGDNELVKEIIKMVAKAKNGQHIAVESDEFKEEVAQAIAAFYGEETEETQKEEKQKTAAKQQEEQQGMSFLELQRRAAEEDGRILAELLGRKDEEKQRDSAGEVLAGRKNTPQADEEFTANLRQLDKREKPIDVAEPDAKEKTAATQIEKEKLQQQEKVSEMWQSISGKLKESFAAEKSAYYVKALAKERAQAVKIDIMA